MFWNKDNRATKLIFDKEGTADTDFGLFYDNKSCETCPPFCCLQLEGSADSIDLEGGSCCVHIEGCVSDCLAFFQALVNSLLP